MKVLITGASGFVGRQVVRDLAAAGHSLRRALRTPVTVDRSPVGEDYVVGEINADTDWREALRGVDAVVHLAARAHILREVAGDPEREFMNTNAEGTRRLAEAAAVAGVGHLIFISSIGVHGAGGEQSLDAHSRLAPTTAYGRSKLAAESALRQIAMDKSLRVTALRPPLVYGPGAPGNLERLLRLLQRGLPLPLGSVRNQRSFIGVRNLASALLACLATEGAGFEAYPVADVERVSTPELLRLLAQSMQRSARLWPAPPALLRTAGTLTGRRHQIEQLCGSLTVDGTAFARRFSWTQPYSQSEGLTEMAQVFVRGTMGDRAE